MDNGREREIKKYILDIAFMDPSIIKYFFTILNNFFTILNNTVQFQPKVFKIMKKYWIRGEN